MRSWRAKSWSLAQPVPVIPLRFPRSPLGSSARLLGIKKPDPTAARYSVNRGLIADPPGEPCLSHLDESRHCCRINDDVARLGAYRQGNFVCAAGLDRSSLTWRSLPAGLYPSPYWRWRFCLIDRRRPDSIFVNPFERGEIGPDLLLKACEFGLEGLVSKHRDRPYQSGRSKHWIKVKNRKHPAFDRVQEAHRRA